MEIAASNGQHGYCVEQGKDKVEIIDADQHH
jgi:hypothetical protein